jgi:large subunit ribosomal protein L4
MGPVPRDHGFDLPKKVRALGLRHALSSKAADGKLIVLDAARTDSHKTRELVRRLADLGIGSALVIDGEALDPNFALAVRNIPLVDVLPAQGANVYDILRRDTLLLTRDAVARLEARLT